jgi:hypothetical protein
MIVLQEQTVIAQREDPGARFIFPRLQRNSDLALAAMLEGDRQLFAGQRMLRIIRELRGTLQLRSAQRLQVLKEQRRRIRQAARTICMRVSQGAEQKDRTGQDYAMPGSSPAPDVAILVIEAAIVTLLRQP